MTFNYEHDCPFEAYITNLGKYTEGELIGEWVKFPCDEDELAKVFERIGIGSEDIFGNVYEEYFITDYDIYVSGLGWEMLGEYANIDRLNEIATMFTELCESDFEKLEAVLEVNGANSIDDIEEIINDIDNYDLYRGVNNDFDLGYYWIEESGCYDTKTLGCLSNYIDYEGFGSDTALNECGGYSKYGYIVYRG